jgi:N-dimethylarginine dimethylaminohydrolase
MPFHDLSEHGVTPDLLIVHDPTEFDAFRNFSSARTSDDLLKRFLFRDHAHVEQYHEQHTQFVRTLRTHVQTKYLSELLDQPDLSVHEKFLQDNPNHVFTHDAILTIPWIPKGYFLGNMKMQLRQHEPQILAKVAEKLGLKELVKIPPHHYLEGGDVIPFCDDDKKMLLIGFGPRTSRDTLVFLRDTLIKNGMIDEILGFQLASWRINLDGCFFPVSRDVAVCHRESIIGGVRLQEGDIEEINPLEYLQKSGMQFIEATKEESFRWQACNFVCLGQNRLVAYNMTNRINDILRSHGLVVIGIPGNQLVKGNGGPHCMTRPIYLDPQS